MFLDEYARELHQDWEEEARNAVAGLRLADGAHPGDTQIRTVVEMLAERRPHFARHWARHDVREETTALKNLRHRDVGDLTLRMLAFDVRASPGQQRVLFQASPGSSSAEALSLLGALSSTRRRAARVDPR
ncbi:hypothetical protein WCD74_22340 [Actinomycetospora sp. OC33-EN08]|uniref:MmyB-like transcription regulator ligand binding domain-containing protein n=1 Tax=Actinomycetospora aurantiaca TaxID=3129233 RepID=A0ABU8MU72_9PSEU